MNGHQVKRYQKVLHEHYYLLDREVKRRNYVFTVSGSTKNVYHVTIYPNNKTIFCSCPDAKSWAKKQNCVCKHSLFVLYRVLKVFKGTQESFFGKLVFTNDEMERIKTSFDFLQAHLDDRVTNKVLSARFEQTKRGEKPTAVAPQREFGDDDLCGVCYENLRDGVKRYKVCPECHNVLHEPCLNKWLESGSQLCVYCRGKVWVKTKKVSDGGGDYINLS